MDKAALAIRRALANVPEDDINNMVQFCGLDGNTLYDLEDRLEKLLHVDFSSVKNDTGASAVKLGRIIMRPLSDVSVESFIVQEAAAACTDFSVSRKSKWVASLTKLFSELTSLCDDPRVQRRLLLRAFLNMCRTFHCIPFDGDDAHTVLFQAVSVALESSAGGGGLKAALQAALQHCNDHGLVFPTEAVARTVLAFALTTFSTRNDELLAFFKLLLSEGRAAAQLTHFGSLAVFDYLPEVQAAGVTMHPLVPREKAHLSTHTDLSDHYLLLAQVVAADGKLHTQRMLMDVTTGALLHQCNAENVKLVRQGPGQSVIGLDSAHGHLVVWGDVHSNEPLGSLPLPMAGGSKAVTNWLAFEPTSCALAWGCARPGSDVVAHKKAPLLWARASVLDGDTWALAPLPDAPQHIVRLGGLSYAVSAVSNSFTHMTTIFADGKMVMRLPVMCTAVHGHQHAFDVVCSSPPCIVRCVDGVPISMPLPLHDILIDAAPFAHEC